MPEFDCIFSKRGSLGLELIESPTGYTVLKSAGDGQAAMHNLQAEDTIIFINGNAVGASYDKALNMLRRSGRPVTITFVRPTTQSERIKFLGEKGVARGALGRPPIVKTISPRLAHERDRPQITPSTQDNRFTQPPPPANKPAALQNAPPPPPNKPKPGPSKSSAAALYNNVAPSSAPPIAPPRPRKHRAKAETAGDKTEMRSPRNDVPSEAKPEFVVPSRSNAGGNGFTVPPRRGDGFTVPPRRGNAKSSLAKQQVPSQTQESFVVPARGTNTKNKSKIVARTTVQSSTVSNRPKRHKARPVVVAVPDENIPQAPKTQRSQGMYGSVTGGKIQLSNEEQQRSYDQAQKAAAQQRLRQVPERQNQPGSRPQSSSDQSTVGGFYGGVVEGVQVLNEPTLGRKGSDLFQAAMSNRKNPSPSIPNRPKPNAKGRSRQREVANSVAAVVSPQSAHPVQVPAHRPDPKPKGVGAVGSALSGLMADLDSQVGKVQQIAQQSRRYEEEEEEEKEQHFTNKYGESNYADAFAQNQNVESEQSSMIKYTRSMIFGKKDRHQTLSTSLDSDRRDPRLGPRITREMVFGRRPGDGPVKLTKDMVFGASKSAPLPALDEFSGSGAIRCMEATYDFEAERHDELTFKKGDVIYDVADKDADWVLGWRKGKRGAFPRSYAKVKDDISTRAKWKAKWKFEAEMSDELSFPAGAIICGLESKDNEWAWGSFEGSRGVVPKEYLVRVNHSQALTEAELSLTQSDNLDVRAGVNNALEAVAAVEQATASLLKLQDKYGIGGDKQARTKNSFLSSRTIPSGAKIAIVDFVGERIDELTFRKGDRVDFLRSHDADWDFGEANGKKGLYPKGFVR